MEGKRQWGSPAPPLNLRKVHAWPLTMLPEERRLWIRHCKQEIATGRQVLAGWSRVLRRLQFPWWLTFKFSWNVRRFLMLDVGKLSQEETRELLKQCAETLPEDMLFEVLREVLSAEQKGELSEEWYEYT